MTDLDDIEQRCLLAVLEGGDTWLMFKAEAEVRMGLPWPDIKDLLDERYSQTLQPERTTP